MKNREILFRVWDKSKKFFNYQYSESFIPCWVSNPILDSPVKFDGLRCDVEIQQFSGVYDKKSRPIFEGDIISVNSLIFVCDFLNHGFVFRAARPKDNQNYFLTINPSSEKMIEILGNIFENIELIEK